MHIVIAVFMFVISIVLGPLVIIFTYLHFRRRSINKRELQAIRDELSQIRMEIADIKDQIADFIIKTH